MFLGNFDQVLVIESLGSGQGAVSCDLDAFGPAVLKQFFLVKEWAELDLVHGWDDLTMW